MTSTNPRLDNCEKIVIVVDDDEEIRTLVGRIIEQEGYTVYVAANGYEALELCRNHNGRIDLVITDNEMPRLNGTDLCAHLLEERPFIRIIMMTGEKREERKGDLELPLLQKPFGRAALIEKVREVLAVPRLPEA